jgi:NADP-dependent 3-hydroxy acid dehydrogenase YdfG
MAYQHDLSEQVVLVAGASSGMGKATAIAAAEAGAHVVLAARNAVALEQIVASIKQKGGSAIAVATDMLNRDEVDHLLEATLQTYGRISTVVYSVGTNLPRRTIDELTAESWANMIAINLTTAFHLTQAVLPIFRKQEEGLLIYISSSSAKKPDRSGISYQMGKTGIVGLAHGTMEEEREHGIRTTVIFPGLTDTPLVLKRPAPTPPEVMAHALQPEDVAESCLFVMSLPPRAHVPELTLYPGRL